MILKEEKLFNEIFKEDIEKAGENYCEECIFIHAHLAKRYVFIKKLLNEEGKNRFIDFERSYNVLAHLLLTDINYFKEFIKTKSMIRTFRYQIYKFEVIANQYGYSIFDCKAHGFFDRYRINKKKKYYNKIIKEEFKEN